MCATSNRVVVALFFGGVSSEHEISCLTAGGVARAIDPERFDVVGIGITKSGRWVRVPWEEISALEVVSGKMPRVDASRPTAVLLADEEKPQIATRDGEQLTNIRDFDVAFALLHGPFGEDGTIQGMFEMLGVRYVGAGVAASAISIDKGLMKSALAQAGLPVSPWVCFEPQQWASQRADLESQIAALGYPVFVKPARGGSSVGISRVERPDLLAAAVELAQIYDPKVIVEKGVLSAREIEVAVLGTGDGQAPRASLPGEIIVHDSSQFYDYNAKYLPEEQVTLQVPAELEPEITAKVRALAKQVFQTLSVEGLSRIDLFVLPDGEVLVNELNTMPGFTRLSMFPMMWAATGLEYTALITDLIEQACNRRLGLR